MENESLNNILRYRRKLYESYGRAAGVLRLLRQFETEATTPLRKKKRRFWKCAASDGKNVTASKIIKDLLGTFSEAPLKLNGAPPKCF